MKTEWYGLTSSKTLKQVKELIPFENDLTMLLKNIGFRKTRNYFQENMQEDIQLIKLPDKTVNLTNKKANLFQLTEVIRSYHKRHKLNYKKASNNIKRKTYIYGKIIIKRKEVLNRLGMNDENSSFITWKECEGKF